MQAAPRLHLKSCDTACAMWQRRTKQVANALKIFLGCEYAEGSSQVHNDLTFNAFLCVDFFEEPVHVNTEEQRAE